MQDKSKIIGRIFRAWLDFPDLRFGEFLQRASAKNSLNDIFYIEDEELACRCEEFAKNKYLEKEMQLKQS